MGRTGSYFAWQAYDVKPDIMTLPKPGCEFGRRICFWARLPRHLWYQEITEQLMEEILCMCAVSKVFDIFEQDNILAHVQELTPYLEEKLDALVDKYPIVAARRGKGFMQGLVIEGTTVGSVVTKALANGLLVISAGSDVLRLVPPLVITKEHINEMIEKLEKSLA
ncbi:MAG: aminotransferase class III-fold pyridoxal phosphate-dependent enzyme [Blautia obeum]